MAIRSIPYELQQAMHSYDLHQFLVPHKTTSSNFNPTEKSDFFLLHDSIFIVSYLQSTIKTENHSQYLSSLGFHSMRLFQLYQQINQDSRHQ